MDTAKDAIGGVADVVLPSQTLSDYWEGPLHVLKHPIDSAKLVGSSMLEAQMDQFRKAGEAPTLSEKIGHGAAGMIPMLGPMAANAGEEIGKGNFARGGGQALGLLGGIYTGSKLKGAPKEPAPVVEPPRPIRGLLPERTGPRFVAGEAGVADTTVPHRRNFGNPNEMLVDGPDAGTPTLADIGEVVDVGPTLAAQGFGPHGGLPPSLGKQRTRAAQAAAEGMKAERARQPRVAQPVRGRERLNMDVEAIGGEGFPDRGPARATPGTPSSERVTNQRPREAYYPPEDPNVPGIGDVAPIAQEGPRPIALPAGHQSALRKLGVPEDKIRTMTIPQADKILKATGQATTETPKAPKVARLTPKKNKHGEVVPDLRDTNMAGPAEQVKADLKAGTAVGRPYRMLSDKDLETLGIRGDAAAIKELIGRKRGEFTQFKPGDVDPSRPAPSLRDKLKDERGFIDLSGILPGRKPKGPSKIDFDAPVAAGGGRGNIFHRIVNPVFDKNFANWVNARRATKIEGIIKRREFADLDAAGFDGITAFQEGLLKDGRFADLKTYFDEKHTTLQESGVKLGFRENYLPQLWENSADDVFKIQKKLGLSPSFTLERVLENYKKGIEAGLKPKYKTIGELVGWYEERANKAIADRQFFDHLRETKQILPEGKAPTEWQTINPDHFPVQKFKTKRGEYVTKNYKAPAPIAKAINNYLGEGHEAFKWVGDKASITKNIVLSAGVPKTGINAHGFNIAARNVMARGLLKGGAEAAKYLVHPTSAKKWFDAHIASAPDAVKHGLTLTTEEHQIGTPGSTHLLREPKTKPGKVLNKGFNKVLELHGKFFEDPLFQNVLPTLKLKHWSALVEEMKKGGMDETAAKKGAADATNALYGGINWEAMQRSRDLQNLMRGIVLAPDWFETQYRIGKGMGKTVRDPNSMRGLPYKRVAMNLIASYVAADVMNYAINGAHMWENDPGHALDIKAGKVGGKIRYIRPFGTAADFARLPFDAIAGMAQGDLSTTSNILKNRRSTITKLGSNLLMNQDDFGKPIFGDDMYGRKTPVTTQLGKAGREVAEVVTPQYLSGSIDYATGRAKSKEEAILGSVEAPVRYSRESTKRHSRYRPQRRRPSR